MNVNECSGSTLAYLGDAVWSLYVREYLVEKGYTKAKDLQTKSIRFVSAKAQASFYQRMHDENFLSDTEEEMFKRGRNHHGTSSPKNTDVVTYRISTGFESMIGYLYMIKDEARLKEIWNKVKAWMEE